MLSKKQNAPAAGQYDHILLYFCPNHSGPFFIVMKKNRFPV